MLARPVHGFLVWIALLAFAAVCAIPGTGLTSPGEVLSHQKISDTDGSFSGVLGDDDSFGRAVASLGDLDGAGPSSLAIAVGASGDDDGGVDRGAVWILFLDTDGTVMSYQKISDTEGGFSGTLANTDGFGVSVAALGDLDAGGPSVQAIAVGAGGDNDGGGDFRGAVWILFLDDDGTVMSHQKISDTQGGFTGTLDDFDVFGISVASLGDLDGGGSSAHAIAVGAYFDDDGGAGGFAERGAVWILFLASNGTVMSHQKISDTQGGFTGVLDDGDWFGSAIAFLGDLDGGGVGDIVVGAAHDADGGSQSGALWVLFLNSNGTVSAHQKISATEGGFSGVIEGFDNFGISLAALGDVDEDGVIDVAVGANGDDDGGASIFADRGAVWVLFLDDDGTVLGHQKISDAAGGFTGTLDDLDVFGVGVAALGDLDGDGFIDLASGASADDDGGTNSNRGAVWILFLDGPPPVGVPDAFVEPAVMLSSFPNPFRSHATFSYATPREMHVRASILDAQGRVVFELLEREVAPGGHAVTWSGRDPAGRRVPAGTYFARFEFEETVRTAKVVLLP